MSFIYPHSIIKTDDKRLLPPFVVEKKRGKNAFLSEKLHFFRKNCKTLHYIEELWRHIPVLLTDLSLLWLHMFMGTNKGWLWSPESSPAKLLSCQLLFNRTGFCLYMVYTLIYTSRELYLLKDCYCTSL